MLAATSNPEAFTAQRARLADDATVSARIVEEVSARNAAHTAAGEWASLGFVIGATVEWTDAGAHGVRRRRRRSSAPASGIRAPGPATWRASGPAAPQVVASESRSLLSAGPDRLTQTIATRADEYRSARG